MMFNNKVKRHGFIIYYSPF